MNAEIIAVGTELLLGQVVNTNATFIAQQLAELGIDVYHQSVVGDNPPRLVEALKLADTRSNLIILSGGLGPTEDDLTKQVVAEYLHRRLEINQPAMEKIKQQLTRHGRLMTDNNRRQALSVIPGIPVNNPLGLAVGSFVSNGDQHYLLLPGPPRELKAMFIQSAKPLLAKVFPNDKPLTSRVMRFYGIGESKLVDELSDLIDCQTNPTLAPYAKEHEVTLRLSAKGDNLLENKINLDQLEAKIQKRVGAYFYGYGDDNSLAKVTVEALKQQGKTLTAVESLTGGLFQSSIVDIPGASKVFAGGLVTYSPEMKKQLANVSQEIIDQYGVVSSQCAKAMAEGGQQATNADISISFTGSAGPEPLEGKEAGTVWIGIAEKGHETVTKVFYFQRDRLSIRQATVMAGLNLIRQRL